MKDVNNPPAMPTAEWQMKGMELRDHFAGLAMQALIARRGGGALGVIEVREVTEESYILADAMMEAREKQ